MFIDWSGTLSKSKFWGHLEKSSREDQELFNLVEENLFKTNISLLKPWMKAEITSEDINKKIAEEINVDFERVHKEFIKGCELMEFVTPQIPNLIKRLRETGVKVFIASNNMDSFDRWTIPAMKLKELFDGIINSFTIKALKHDFDESGKSLFFHDTLKMEGVKPHETVLIDDSEDKGNLLTNYGINYIRINEDDTLEKNLLKILN